MSSDESPRQRRRWDDREEEEDDRPRRKQRRRDEDDEEYEHRRRPTNVQTVGALLLAGGIYALLQSVIIGINTICLWPGVYFSLVWAIFAIIRSSNILQNTDRGTAPRMLAILQILLILNCDIINMAMGIVNLVLLNDEKVRDYYSRKEDYRD